ncbi:MAG: hypothetical protein Q8L66_04050 [Caulobacter sp.]|nr:hypothetical protein [Caulobacter sp.]
MSGQEHEQPSTPEPLFTAHDEPSSPSVADIQQEADARLFSSSDFLSLDPEIETALSKRIDLYYNVPLEIFPFGQKLRKPDRFHVIYKAQIEERFPDDEGMRREISGYGRLIFGWLVTYMLGKRALQVAALVGFWFLVANGPSLLQGVVVGAMPQTLGIALAMLLTFGVFFGVNALIFVQYRLGLENRSYSLSREIVQYTRTLQNDYTTIRALPDQSETHFQTDGPGWGRRSAFLVRMLMWIAARMEYLEKYVQVSMWRVRRERYWMEWAGGILTVLGLGVWILFLVTLQPGTENAGLFRGLQGLALVLGLATSWASYFLWRTPVTLVQDKLDPNSWIRYATLDLDNTIGEQVRRDKERLVEYRNLTRGR